MQLDGYQYEKYFCLKMINVQIDAHKRWWYWRPIQKRLLLVSGVGLPFDGRFGQHWVGKNIHLFLATNQWWEKISIACIIFNEKKEKKRGTLSIAELEIFINWVSNNLSFSCVEKKNVSLLGVNVGCAWGGKGGIELSSCFSCPYLASLLLTWT